jgi:hypothetical protein
VTTESIGLEQKIYQTELIELSIPPTADLVVLARFTAATIASRADFDVDEIEDLRLAVDELCVSCGPVEHNRNVRLEFRRAHRQIRITCIFDPLPAALLDGLSIERSWDLADDLQRQLLDALVDDHGKGERDGRPCAWLEKRGGGSAI